MEYLRVKLFSFSVVDLSNKDAVDLLQKRKGLLLCFCSMLCKHIKRYMEDRVDKKSLHKSH